MSFKHLLLCFMLLSATPTLLIGQQQLAATQDPAAITLIQAVLSSSVPSTGQTNSLLVQGTVQTWKQAAVNVPFNIASTAGQWTFATTADGTAFQVTEGNGVGSVTRAGVNTHISPRWLAKGNWLFYPPQLQSLLSSPSLNIRSLPAGIVDGKSVAVMALKDISLGPLNPTYVMQDLDATYLEIDPVLFQVVAVTDCSVPMSHLTASHCVMHRIEFSDFRVDGGFTVPHTMTEKIGLATQNVFTIQSVAVQ